MELSADDGGPREDGADLFAGVTNMHDDGKVKVSGEIKLRAKRHSLHLWRRGTSREVEADLTDGDNDVVFREFAKARERVCVACLGAMRMYPDRDRQDRPRGRERDRAFARGDVVAAGHDRHDPGCAGPREDGVEIAEAPIGQVRVRVDVRGR